MAIDLITGGAGFIGSHLLRLLLDRGRSIRVVDNFQTGDRKRLESMASFVEIFAGDAASPALLQEALRDVECVYHLAAIPSVSWSQTDPMASQRSGEIAALNVLHQSALAGVRRVILASSAAVYGNPQTSRVDESAPLAPLSHYGAGKACMELHGAVIAREFPNTDVGSLRFFNVYGPGQNPASDYSGVITIFANCIHEERSPVIYGDGNQTRDFVFVEDVAEACFRAMGSHHPLNGEAFNIGSGSSISMLQLWQVMQGLTNSARPPIFHPPRPVEIRHSCADVSKARKVFQFEATCTLAQGLGRLLGGV